jgi:hypothetical protein
MAVAPNGPSAGVNRKGRVNKRALTVNRKGRVNKRALTVEAHWKQEGA